MYLTRIRIYCERKRDKVLFRFRSWSDAVKYTRENNETPRTLPVISRAEFIERKNSRFVEPEWVPSKLYPGMAILRERTS